MSPSLFFIYINGLLCEIKEHPELSVKFSENMMFSLLFANDFVGIAETGSALQMSVNIVYNCSKHWQFEANVKKCAIVFFKIRRSFW